MLGLSKLRCGLEGQYSPNLQSDQHINMHASQRYFQVTGGWTDCPGYRMFSSDVVYYFSIGWNDVLLRVFVNFWFRLNETTVNDYELRSRYHKLIKGFTREISSQWNNMPESYWHLLYPLLTSLFRTVNFNGFSLTCQTPTISVEN